MILGYSSGPNSAETGFFDDLVVTGLLEPEHWARQMLNGPPIMVRLTAIIATATVIVVAASPAHAQQHRLECPREAPTV
jgi:hypothetical protein